MGCGQQWHGVQPIVELSREGCSLVQQWPPTLIVHGDMDSVVPVQHSEQLLALLAWRGGGQADSTRPGLSTKRASDVLIIVPGGRHTFDLVANEATSAMLGGVTVWLEQRFS